MNKRELIDAVAGEVGDGVTKQDVEQTIEAFTRVVGSNLRNGEPVQLVGFGTFEPRKRSARTSRNPQTGESVKVPATTAPAFKASQLLKDYVGGKSGAAERFKGGAAAKKTAKKGAAKKGAAKKGAAKKGAAKKGAAKKGTAGKSAKTSAKKVAKKAAGKKATAKKSAKKAAKKSAR